jgi:hypothetical protein
MLSGRSVRVLLAIAVCVALNAAITLQNAWPTLWAVPGTAISVELLVLLAVIVLYMERRRAMAGTVAWGMTAVLFLLIAGRYAAVTSHSLFGRPINLFFDLPHLPEVVAMTVGARSSYEIAMVAAVGLVLLAAAMLSVRWGVGVVARALSDGTIRRPAGVVAAAGILLFFATSLPPLQQIEALFARPVSPVYVRQAGFLAEAVAGTGDAAFASQPAVTTEIEALKGADVFVFFLESYGEAAYRLPAVAGEVRARVAAAERELRGKGWHMASGFFRSPTFGGGSWLAHASFLAGVTVSENREYELLLSGNRTTLVRDFAKAGYRTVALMPGLKLAWPEGRFYGFDAIYDAATLDYGGPAFGWWMIPDQFTLGWLDERELRLPGRKPLFVVCPTIMSHMPFSPVPAYLPDWTKALDPAAYAQAGGLPAALGNWTEAYKSYRSAMIYNLDVIEGFIAEKAPPSALVVALGDHQPPGLVSGAGASWLVPVHVFSRDESRIAAFREAGLKDGLVPSGADLGDFAALHHKFAAALK